jgi:hypothetical protein
MPDLVGRCQACACACRKSRSFALDARAPFGECAVAAIKKSFVRKGGGCHIPLPFDPKERALSYTNQRECVEAIESAKRSETRARRIEAAVRALST